MKDKIFYRVELDHTKYGPYNNCGPNSMYIPHHNGTKRWPSPASDDGLKKYEDLNYQAKKDYRFGFKDMEQLKSWFSKELRLEMFEKGYVIRMYRSKQYFISKKQAVFIPGELINI